MQNTYACKTRTTVQLGKAYKTYLSSAVLRGAEISLNRVNVIAIKFEGCSV